MEVKDKKKSIIPDFELPPIKGRIYSAVEIAKEKEMVFSNGETDEIKLQTIANFKHIQLNILKMLSPIIEEIANCLYLRITAASVTLTNHLLETMVKFTLAYADSRCRPIGKDEKFEDYLAENLNKFMGLELGKNIEKLYEYGIINEKEKKRLRLLKKEYRNPFSHASNNDELRKKETLIAEVSLSEVSKFEGKEIPTRNIKVTGNPYLLINARMEVFKNNALGYFCEIMSFLKMFDNKLTQMRNLR